MRKLQLVSPIEFCGQSRYDLIHCKNFDMVDNSIDPELTIAQLLAASVDAVKDPVFND